MNLAAADVNQPFYYLHNFHTALNWVSRHSGDLFSAQEQQQIADFQQLPQTAQALLLRMVMRKGEYFRHSALNYPEIPDQTTALQALQQAAFCDSDAPLPLTELLLHLRKAELIRLLERHGGPQTAALSGLKKTALARLAEQQICAGKNATLHGWLQNHDAMIHLHSMPLFDTVRLLFFGNSWQDWSEFVLTGLGHQHYESVPLSRDSRAFQCRDEVEFFRHLSAVNDDRSRLSQAVKERQLSKAAAAQAICQQVQTLRSLTLPDTTWLQHSWHKAMARSGRELERYGDLHSALDTYHSSRHRDACVRRLRVQERLAASDKDFSTLAQQATDALQHIEQPESRISIQRIRQRACRKAGLPAPALSLPRPVRDVPARQLTLPGGCPQRVEYQVLDYYNTQHSGQCWYVENTLFPALFALLFWPALYKPVAGAFYHPFQGGPADLFQDDFAGARHHEIQAGFAALEDGSYRTTILTHWHSKQGISCPLIHWPSLDEALITQALEVISAGQLAVIFRHLLTDLRHHSRGLPDLIRLGDNASAGWQLIEVKGPGDRLQDHQRLWLEFFLQQGMAAEVCYVSYE